MIVADLESRVENLEGRCTSLEIAVEKVSQKVDLFIEESRESRNRQDAGMREIRQSIDGMGKHVRNLTMTAMGGIIAAGVGITAIVVAVLLK